MLMNISIDTIAIVSVIWVIGTLYAIGRSLPEGVTIVDAFWCALIWPIRLGVQDESHLRSQLIELRKIIKEK